MSLVFRDAGISPRRGKIEQDCEQMDIFSRRTLIEIFLLGASMTYIFWTAKDATNVDIFLGFFVWSSLAWIVVQTNIRKTFEPYSIQIIPKWEPLIKDFELADTQEQIEQFLKIAYDRNNVPGGDLIKYGVRIQVLSADYSPRGVSRLRYVRTRTNYFTTNVDLEEPIDELSSPSLSSVIFLVTETYFGYDLRFEIDRGGSSEIPDATHVTLPKSLFWEFNNQTTTAYTKRQIAKVTAKRNEDLKEHGWTHKQSDYDYPFYFPDQVDHKYYLVSFKKI